MSVGRTCMFSNDGWTETETKSYWSSQWEQEELVEQCSFQRKFLRRESSECNTQSQFSWVAQGSKRKSLVDLLLYQRIVAIIRNVCIAVLNTLYSNMPWLKIEAVMINSERWSYVWRTYELWRIQASGGVSVSKWTSELLSGSLVAGGVMNSDGTQFLNSNGDTLASRVSVILSRFPFPPISESYWFRHRSLVSFHII